MNFSTMDPNLKNFFLFGGGGVWGAKLSNFFTENPNLFFYFFWRGGGVAGGGGYSLNFLS